MKRSHFIKILLLIPFAAKLVKGIVKPAEPLAVLDYEPFVKVQFIKDSLNLLKVTFTLDPKFNIGNLIFLKNMIDNKWFYYKGWLWRPKKQK